MNARVSLDAAEDDGVNLQNKTIDIHCVFDTILYQVFVFCRVEGLPILQKTNLKI
jgi:hypothetical protein